MPGRPQPAHGEIGAIGVVLAAQDQHRDHFHGGQRLPVMAGGDSGLELQILELAAREQAHQFGIRSFAHHQHMQRIGRYRERATQAVHQRQDGQQHRYRERDAQGRHDSGGFAHHQIPPIVGEWNSHGVNPCS